MMGNNAAWLLLILAPAGPSVIGGMDYIAKIYRVNICCVMLYDDVDDDNQNHNIGEIDIESGDGDHDEKDQYCDFNQRTEILVYFMIFNHEILVYFSLSIDLWKLNDYKFHMVYDFMHQRMILFVLYGLFHKFHANVAFPAIYTDFYQIGNIASIAW